MDDEAAKDPAGWMLRQPGQEREWIRQNNVIYGGLIGVGLVIVQPFLTEAPLSQVATVSVIAFAVAIPLLAALVMINQQETFRGRLSSSGFLSVARAIAMLASGTGVVAAFWNMSWVAGVVVICSMVIAVAAHSAGYVRLEWPVLRRLSAGAEAAAEAKAAAATAAAEKSGEKAASRARAADDPSVEDPPIEPKERPPDPRT
jgi:hypothetical protein